MIYFFTGNNDFQIRDEAQKWKNHFVSKYGDFNFFHIKDILGVSKDYLAEAMLSSSFFGDKKLIIIENYPPNAENTGDYTVYDAFFEENLKKFAEENILLFISVKADKRTKSYKLIHSLSEVRDYSFKEDDEALQFVAKRYGTKIDTQALRLLGSYKGLDVAKMVSEIEKLSILYDNISSKHIQSYVIPEIEESIFLIVDNLMQKNTKEFFKNTSMVLNYMSVYAFYGALLGNLRNFLYIFTLKKVGFPTSQIASTLGLGNKAFLVSKNFKMTANELQSVYIGLVNLDKKMKTGKMIGSDDEDFLYEIEREVLKYTQTISS